MELQEFHALSAALRKQAPAGDFDELNQLAVSYRDVLASSPMFSDVAATVTEDPDGVLRFDCRLASLHDTRDIIADVESLWLERMSHPFWEAHTVDVSGDVLGFLAATRFGDTGPYITVRILINAARLPQQRCTDADD